MTQARSSREKRGTSYGRMHPQAPAWLAAALSEKVRRSASLSSKIKRCYEAQRAQSHQGEFVLMRERLRDGFCPGTHGHKAYQAAEGEHAMEMVLQAGGRACRDVSLPRGVSSCSLTLSRMITSFANA